MGRRGGSRQLGGVGGAAGVPPRVVSRLPLAQKAAHLSALSRAPDGLSPTRGRRSPGPAGSGARALSLSLSLSLALPLFPPQALRTVDRRGKLPSLQRRERGSPGSALTPVEMAHTPTKTLLLFTSRPDHPSTLHSFCLLEQFFYAQCRAV